MEGEQDCKAEKSALPLIFPKLQYTSNVTCLKYVWRKLLTGFAEAKPYYEQSTSLNLFPATFPLTHFTVWYLEITNCIHFFLGIVASKFPTRSYS